jgi:hypothetical protein
MAELYLDLGVNCGWCLHWQSKPMTHGCKDFRRCGNDRVMYRSFRLWLIQKQREVEAAGEKLELIGYEYIDFVPKKARRHYGLHTYGGFRALLLAWCETNSIPTVPESDLTWDVVKLHITGIRSAAKELVTKRIEKILGTKLDHNEADAIAVKFTAHNEHPHQPQSRPPRARQDHKGIAPPA